MNKAFLPFPFSVLPHGMCEEGSSGRATRGRRTLMGRRKGALLIQPAHLSSAFLKNETQIHF